jgi:hypothetical protein
MRIDFKLAAAAVVLVLVPRAAAADRRALTQTFEYPTQPESALEILLWNTHVRDGLGDDGGTSAAEQQLEIEYGITDRTSIGIYQTVAQGPGEGLHFAATKLEMRHRFAERGQWPIDLTLYGSVAKPFGRAAAELEPRLIVARDFGAFTLAANGIAEVVIEQERDASGEKKIETEFVPGWAVGLTYEALPKLKLGAENWGEAPKVGDKREVFTWAGPAVSWSPSTRLWLTGTVGFGLNDRSADLIARFILAVGL